MAWWVIKNLESGDSYSSDIFPLKAAVKSVNISEGHELPHKEFEVVCGDFTADLRTGIIWKSGKIIASVDNPERLVLFKRIKRDGSSGNIVSETIFLGFCNLFTGTIVRITDDNHYIEPFVVGIPSYVS